MHGVWLCFGDICMSLDVKTKVNMVQGQQDSPLNKTSSCQDVLSRGSSV